MECFGVSTVSSTDLTLAVGKEASVTVQVSAAFGAEHPEQWANRLPSRHRYGGDSVNLGR